MKLSSPFILILFFICLFQSTESKTFVSTDISMIQPSLTDSLNTNAAIIETFVDSLTIGEKGKCKIELIKYRFFDDSYAIVKFYTKKRDDWYIQNTYLYECNALMSLDPNIADFNNDYFNDITFVSTQSARSANEIRRLFIYDNTKKELISIVNSEEYPNMQYNKELDCIDAFLFHGGCSTVFAKIEGDRLKDFASITINNGINRTVYEIDEFGSKKLIKQDKIDPDDVYIRYSNYKPLKEQ